MVNKACKCVEKKNCSMRIIDCFRRSYEQPSSTRQDRKKKYCCLIQQKYQYIWEQFEVLIYGPRLELPSKQCWRLGKLENDTTQKHAKSSNLLWELNLSEHKTSSVLKLLNFFRKFLFPTMRLVKRCLKDTHIKTSFRVLK